MSWSIEANRPGSKGVSPVGFGVLPKRTFFPCHRGTLAPIREKLALPRVALITVLSAMNAVQAADPAPSPPDRREIWVPADQLDAILKKDPKAVLLSREQYEALLRDAKRNAKPVTEPPQRATLTFARYQAQLDGGVVQVIAEFTVNVLSDQWAQVPFELDGASLGSLRFDGTTALMRPQTGKPAARSAGQKLIIRGRGEHKLTAEFSIPVQHESGASKIHLKLPQAAASFFAMDLPPNVQVESDKPVNVKKSDEKTVVALAPSAAEPDVTLIWRPTGELGNGATVVSQTSSFIYSVDAERVRADLGLVLTAALGKLPNTFRIDVPAGAKVLQVEGAEVSKWSLADNTVTVDLVSGDRTAAAFRLLLETPSLNNAAKASVALPVPKVQGVSRVGGAFAVIGNPGISVRDIQTGTLTIQTEGAFEPVIERSASFVAAYKFLALPDAPRIAVSRIAPRLDADLDTLVEFKQEAIFLERTIMLREIEGEIFSATIAIPADEEVLSVQRADGSEPDWRLENKKVNIRWSDQLAAGEKRSFKIRTRIEPANWTQPGADGIAFSLGDARIENVEKVTGYIALKADPSLRVETEIADALEPRDGRQTPVRGDFAWFRRQDFQLKTQITKRAPELQASVTGYALPMENALDLHAQIDFAILYSGVKKVRIKVPAKFAAQFYFDGPQVAERNLDGDTWTVSFQKEITGNYSLSVTAQLPIEKNADDASRFAIEVPVITPLDVARVSGTWAVEANTETEITFKSTGMNELDTLLAPALPGYQPKHRVIGVFGYLGSSYSLALEGVRHESAPILTTVVDALDLASVISTSGAERHQATYSLRTAGEQFLDVALPPGSKLWSLTVDDQLVKPVSQKENTVRVELPAKLESTSAASVRLLYETSRREWSGSGSQELVAAKLSERIPILKSRWQVFLPDGFSYRKFTSNLQPKIIRTEPVLLAKPLRWLFPKQVNEKESANREQATKLQGQGLEEVEAIKTESSQNLLGLLMKLNRIVVPKIDFHEVTINEAIEFLRKQSHDLDSEESNPSLRGANIVLKAASTSSRVTLNLTNIPLMNALKYVANLAGMKVRIEPSVVEVVALSEEEYLVTKEYHVPDKLVRFASREYLESLGMQFPQGTSMTYVPASKRLVLLNTQENIDFFETLVSGEIASSVQPSAQTNDQTGAACYASMLYKPNRIIIPKVDLRDTTIREAIDFLRQKAREMDATELDPSKRGVNIVLKLDPTVAEQTRITLSLYNISLTEVLRYVANLANLKVKNDPYAVMLLPYSENTETLATREYRVPLGFTQRMSAREYLESQGIQFPTGTTANFLLSSGRLVVRNTQENLDLLDTLVASASAAPQNQFAFNTAGLLPMKLDLPLTGQLFLFEGFYAPENVQFSYIDWWSRARRMWIWFVIGGVAFLFLARRRPWVTMLWGMLALTFVPVCVAESATVTCNALLAGWLLAFVLQRFGVWFVFSPQRVEARVV